MCSTCNYKTYERYEEGNETRLRSTNENININCDFFGKKYKIGNFTIYRCPTCGRKLF